jgi:hypothetical protein
MNTRTLLSKLDRIESNAKIAADSARLANQRVTALIAGYALSTLGYNFLPATLCSYAALKVGGYFWNDSIEKKLVHENKDDGFIALTVLPEKRQERVQTKDGYETEIEDNLKTSLLARRA